MTTTYMISGHLSVTEEEFREHYIPHIDKALAEKGSKFVIGDARGADTLGQAYLAKHKADVTVFHMLETPRNNVGSSPAKGGYETDAWRDAAMTQASDVDILWIRKGREDSGTQRNWKRRRLHQLGFPYLADPGPPDLNLIEFLKNHPLKTGKDVLESLGFVEIDVVPSDADLKAE